MFKGEADLAFTIQGDKSQGQVIFKGKRKPQSGDEWESHLYEILLENGRRINLS
jgi:hypothetical protein